MRRLPKITTKRLRHIFGVLGLHEKDLTVYSILIDLHQATTSQIVARLNIPRQTVYSILLKLRAIGLISLSSQSGIKLFITNPQDIVTVLKRKHAELETVRSDADFIVSETKKSKKLNFRKPTVKYYDGSYGLKNLFQSMLDYYHEPKAVKEFRGYGINTYKDASVRVFLSHFIKKRKKLGVTTKLLIGKEPENFTGGKAQELDISIKHMDTLPQNAGIYILEDKVYMFSFTDDAGLVVENRAIAKFLKNIFDDHWKKE